ncbi:MAG: IPT/TIG domain-containing protein, partial [Pirellulaceae bacterium]
MISPLLAMALLSLSLAGCGNLSADGQQADDSPLKVKTIEPAAGVWEGNVFMLIEGEGFVPGMQVLFDDVPAPSVNVINSQLLQLTTPSLPIGKADVTLRLSDIEASVPEAYEAVSTACDDQTDTDGDGLTDCQEQLGFLILVDNVGFGTVLPLSLTHVIVNSSPHLVDSDGDGLDDFEEFANKSNPRVADSDGDGLGDWEEVHRWLTSPISIDTDGDARGPDGNLPPNSSLFDGNELITIGFTDLTDLII